MEYMEGSLRSSPLQPDIVIGFDLSPSSPKGTVYKACLETE